MELTIEDTDTTPLLQKRRLTCTVRGRRVKTRWYYEIVEPTTGPIRKYPTIDLAYFERTARARDPYQVTLRPWMVDNRD